jgi:hypothetical protein
MELQLFRWMKLRCVIWRALPHSTAIQHELTLITVDAEIAAYPVNQLATL